ncbi:hypothetical protein ACFQ9X_07285 [Catenulispora yoronensis]
MTKFADSLYQSLMDEHGDTLAAMEAHGPAGRSLRPVWASAGTIAAVATAAVGFTAFGGTASAYAVTDNHDGTVTVKVDKPSGVAGANAALARIKSRVAVVEAKPGCPSIDTFRIPGGAAARPGSTPGSPAPTPAPSRSPPGACPPTRPRCWSSASTTARAPRPWCRSRAGRRSASACGRSAGRRGRHRRCGPDRHRRPGRRAGAEPAGQVNTVRTAA